MGWATTVKNLPVLVRVGTRRGGCRQRTPQHSMAVVPVRRSRERRIDLNATALRDRTGATEQQHQGGEGLGLVGGPTPSQRDERVP